MPNKLTSFSPTKIVDYLNCPLLFYFRYILKVKIPTKQIHFIFGSGIHAAIEGIIHNAKASNDDKQDVLKMFLSEYQKDKMMDEEKDLYDEYLKLGKSMIKHYESIHPTLNNLYDLNNGKSELFIKGHLKNPITGQLSSLPISGRIDRLTNSGRIIEYKTAKNKWKEKDVAFKAQTLLYNLWYHTNFGKLPEETVYIILLKKEPKVGAENYQVLTHNTTTTDLASVWEETELIFDKINANEFDRPHGWHPPYCDCYRYAKYLNLE